MQVADAKKVVMSTHKMNETGLIVVLDGGASYFVEKQSGKSTPIMYTNGKYYFDVWVPGAIKNNSEDKTKGADNNMDTSDASGDAEAAGIKAGLAY